MLEVNVRPPLATSIPLYRIACSAPNRAQRCQALIGLDQKLLVQEQTAISRHGLSALGIAGLDADLLQEYLASMEARLGAIGEYEAVARDFQTRTSRRLKLAEQIALEIIRTVQDGRNKGVFTQTGLISRVVHRAEELGLGRGTGTSSLQSYWSRYRGVAHLGLATQVGKDRNLSPDEVLTCSEEIRLVLSTQAPNSEESSYVPALEQIYFRAMPMS